MKEPKVKFKSKSDKEQAANDFQNLKNNPGWKRLVKYYTQKVEYLEKVINGDADEGTSGSSIETMEDLRVARVRRAAAIQFMNLPDILLEGMEFSEGIDLNAQLDPYDKEVLDK